MAKKTVRVAGVDVSAKKLNMWITDGDKEYEFDNDEAGIATLVSIAKKKRVDRLAVEPTGTYGLDLMLAAHAKKIEVVSPNPRLVRKFAEIEGYRAKTDRVDCKVIGAFAVKHDVPVWVPPPVERLNLRAIGRRMAQVIKSGASEKARMKALEATSSSPEVVLQSVRDAIATSEQSANELEQAALELIKADATLASALDILLTMPGIGERSAVKLLSELVFMPDDLTPRQLVAMVGLDPRPVESGDHRGKRRISKLGNARLRGALYMVAHNARQRVPQIAAYYDALCAAGKHHMQAQTAVMRKLLHCIWGMLKHRQAFDATKFRGPLVAAAA
jgi:transposase